MEKVTINQAIKNLSNFGKRITVATVRAAVNYSQKDSEIKEAIKKFKAQKFLKDKIESFKNQKPVKEIAIEIFWKKSKTWGLNPHAEVTVLFKDNTRIFQNGYFASGCGYDKESTVIAEIFNDFLRYKLYRKRNRNNVPYGVNFSDYGHYFSGGIGVSCYYEIAKYLGGKMTCLYNSSEIDIYKVSFR